VALWSRNPRKNGKPQRVTSYEYITVGFKCSIKTRTLIDHLQSMLRVPKGALIEHLVDIAGLALLLLIKDNVEATNRYSDHIYNVHFLRLNESDEGSDNESIAKINAVTDLEIQGHQSRNRKNNLVDRIEEELSRQFETHSGEGQPLRKTLKQLEAEFMQAAAAYAQAFGLSTSQLFVKLGDMTMQRNPVRATSSRKRGMRRPLKAPEQASIQIQKETEPKKESWEWLEEGVEP